MLSSSLSEISHNYSDQPQRSEHEPEHKDSLKELLRKGALVAASRPDLWEKLTPAQQDVLCLMLTGQSMPQAARLLNRSSHTVHDHVKAIYSAFRIHGRVQLVLLFTRLPESEIGLDAAVDAD